jgi:hypothetical protein
MLLAEKVLALSRLHVCPSSAVLGTKRKKAQIGKESMAVDCCMQQADREVIRQSERTEYRSPVGFLGGRRLWLLYKPANSLNRSKSTGKSNCYSCVKKTLYKPAKSLNRSKSTEKSNCYSCVKKEESPDQRKNPAGRLLQAVTD